MTSELLHEVKQAYCVLKQGGPPRKLVQLLVSLIEGALLPCFVLQEGAREQIETEVEYLLEKLGEARELKTGFILKRFRGLFYNLLRDKRIVPRLETTFTSLLPPEEDRECLREEQLFNASVGWEEIKVDIPRPIPYQPQERTLYRKLRLYSLKRWEVGIFLRKRKNGPGKLIQKGAF